MKKKTPTLTTTALYHHQQCLKQYYQCSHPSFTFATHASPQNNSIYPYGPNSTKKTFPVSNAACKKQPPSKPIRPFVKSNTGKTPSSPPKNGVSYTWSFPPYGQSIGTIHEKKYSSG
mmetsp:Transcript_838/g.1281  ORF Transcript_838/g.1281 Transcript_838/m.1281 type:complete len:117 (-) Transcript_838:288-638(-)